MQMPDRAGWMKMFRDAANRTLGEGFAAAGADLAVWERDELGQRRRLDRAFLRCVLGPGVGKPEEPEGAAKLWMAAAGETEWEEARGEIAERGALMGGGEEAGTIETATEAELSGLHAAWRIARQRDDAGLRERCFEAAAWAVEELQPDNATNRPWGAHVFTELWLARGNAGAALYAQTLVHNCQVTFGRPDRVSALVLWDAAEELGWSADQTG